MTCLKSDTILNLAGEAKEVQGKKVPYFSKRHGLELFAFIVELFAGKIRSHERWHGFER